MNNENINIACLGIPGCNHRLGDECGCTCHIKTSEQVWKEEKITGFTGSDTIGNPDFKGVFINEDAVTKIEPLPFFNKHVPTKDERIDALADKVREIIKHLNNY